MTFDAVAPVIEAPAADHWYVSLAPAVQTPGRTASCLPTFTVPTIVGTAEIMAADTCQDAVAGVVECCEGAAATEGARATVIAATTMAVDKRSCVGCDIFRIIRPRVPTVNP